MIYFKYLLILLCLASMLNQAAAQIDRKTVMLGGNASVLASTSGSSFINFNPSAALFINKKVAFGLSNMLMVFDGDFYWGVEPFSRYYFNAQKSQSIYASGSVGFSNLNYSIVGFSAGIGNVWFINKNVGFETELKGFTDLADFSIGMYLGLQVYLSKSR